MLFGIRQSSWTEALLGWATTPFHPDDYLALVNPLWSVRDIRARVERVEPESADAVTLHLRPNANWPGHQAGQHVSLGVEIDGVRHQRTFSLSSAPAAELLRMTVKRNGEGLVSNYIVDRLTPGDLVHLSEPSGDFVLPPTQPGPLLMIAGGSGVTPLHAMLEMLAASRQRQDVVLLCYNHDAADRILADRLERLADSGPGLSLYWLETGPGGEGHFCGEQLRRLVPDFDQRTLYLCGPQGLMDSVESCWRDLGLADALHKESFNAPVRHASGRGGRVSFARSGVEAQGDGSQSVLEMAEASGLRPTHGCRMGICHTCICRLNSGRLRNLRNGEVFDAEGQPVRICIHAPDGDVDMDI